MSREELLDLIDRYIVRGETPKPQSVWDTEEPETYVEGLYKEYGEPAEMRQVLLGTLGKGLEERNASLLNRGLRLIRLIPHPDFVGTMQEIFFTLRNDREHTFQNVALLSLRAMQAIQTSLQKTDPDRSVWAAMWLALLEDRARAIPNSESLLTTDCANWILRWRCITFPCFCDGTIFPMKIEG